MQMALAVRIVRLGSDQIEGEGLRIGTVRRPPRGVPKADFGPKNWYDVWLPNLFLMRSLPQHQQSLQLNRTKPS